MHRIMSIAAVVAVFSTGWAHAQGEPPHVFVDAWGTTGSGDGQFSVPAGVTADAAGQIYVVDSNNHRIQKFGPDGGFLRTWGQFGVGFGEFSSPWGVAVDADGHVYVADRSLGVAHNNRIQKFDGDGAFLTTWGMEGSEDGQFNRPDGVAVDAVGNVYVADEGNSRIQKFNRSGAHLLTWGVQGSENGQFNFPVDVAADADGGIYVVDRNNHRIQKFDSSGNFLTTWGTRGSEEGQFRWPWGVATDAAGHVYVVDTNNHRVQVFDRDGNFLLAWGRSGSGDSQFRFPVDVAVDGARNVYVTDTGNSRVQKFEPLSTNITRLKSQVEALVVAGTLNRGQKRSLVIKLDQILASGNEGRPRVACSVVGALENQLIAFGQSGTLSDVQRQGLLDAAAALRGAFRC